MINAHRVPGTELGFNSRVIAASGNADGNIVPWRAGHLFQTVTFVVNRTASAAFQIRATWIDWDGATARESLVSLSVGNVAPSNIGWTYWAGDHTPRMSSGTPTNTVLPILFGAPFIRFNVLNGTASPLTFTMDALLCDGVVYS